MMNLHLQKMVTNRVLIEAFVQIAHESGRQKIQKIISTLQKDKFCIQGGNDS